MPIDPAALMAFPFEERDHRYERRDTIFYALSVGIGSDPLDERELRFVVERKLEALPSMPTILAAPAPWLHRPEAGLTWRKVVNGEQSVTLHGSVPTEGRVRARTVVEEIVDKGTDGGAILYLSRVIVDSATGDAVATIRQTLICRADGGFSARTGAARPRRLAPDRASDLRHDMATLPQQALLFRLNGDPNPLHCDPQLSRNLGYAGPILHGQCSFGMAAVALLRTVLDYRACALREIGARFSAPVYPGETVSFDFWDEGAGEFRFTGRVTARDALVLADGFALAA